MLLSVLPKVFLVGGALCAIGQLLISKTKMTAARVLVIFVVAGVILTAVGLYQPIVDWAKSGATVPLTGFGYALAKGAMEGAKTSGILGAFRGGIEGTAAGVGAAIVFGYLTTLIFDPKIK